MRSETIARNYAETLFALGEKSGRTAEYAELIDGVAAAVTQSPKVQGILMSPRVPKAEKSRLLGASLPDAPNEFVLFLQAVVKRGRQALLSEISSEYLALLDVKMNRVRAGVTLAGDPDEKTRKAIVKGLEDSLGKAVIATFRKDPEILGGTVVRVGDRVFDGSIRRRLIRLKRELIGR